jgi:hypothetical protein
MLMEVMALVCAVEARVKVASGWYVAECAEGLGELRSHNRMQASAPPVTSLSLRSAKQLTPFG